MAGLRSEAIFFQSHGDDRSLGGSMVLLFDLSERAC
jgi:hypothetical protein